MVLSVYNSFSLFLYYYFFRHSKHLALFIVPLLVDILREVLLRGSKDLESSIFSAHDINLLGLFYALGYSRIDEKLFWPDYGISIYIYISIYIDRCMLYESNHGYLYLCIFHVLLIRVPGCV